MRGAKRGDGRDAKIGKWIANGRWMKVAFGYLWIQLQ
jgi:hypothetical protein